MNTDNIKLSTELESLAKPLQEWLKNHYDLHCQIIINEGFIKVIRDEIGIPCKIED